MSYLPVVSVLRMALDVTPCQNRLTANDGPVERPVVNILHVRHVRGALEREFQDKMDLSDVAKMPERERKQAFLSRALAALAVQYLTGCESKRAAAAVIDGYDDGGYDAVLAQETPAHLWLVQAKWSDEGKAALTLGDPGKMRTGLDQMLNGEFNKFNSRFQAMSGEVDAVISDPNVKITIVVAQMGASALTPRVKDSFDRIIRDINGYDQMVHLEVLGLEEFHGMVRAGIAEPRIDLDLHLDSPGHITSPYRAYQGTLDAVTVAAWYEQYGNRLFNQNIRNSLGATPVNRGIIDTLLSAPENFLYFNNGITLLCREFGRSARQATVPGAPADLHITGVSVVNGAQTVASVYEAMRADPDIAAQAKIWTRIISLEGCPEGFSVAVTRATNTQNQISRRDFASLDESQLRLRDELRLSLQKTYVIKRGDDDLVNVDGCSVDEAAVALACAHPNLEYAVRARHGGDVLFETGQQGAYPILFARNVNAHRVWRAVLLLRAVRTCLESVGDEVEGRAGQAAKLGDLLMAHIVAQRIGQPVFDDMNHDWDGESLPQVAPLARSIFTRLICQADLFFPRAPIQGVLKNRERSATLVAEILQQIEAGVAEPQLPSTYRAMRVERKFNAVTVIVDSGLIADGAILEFRPGTGPQRRMFAPWLAADARRGRATWANDRAKPLIWEFDRKQYSPDGLVRHMTSLLMDKPSSAGQGTRRWYLPGQGCLADVASSVVPLDDDSDQ